MVRKSNYLSEIFILFWIFIDVVIFIVSIEQTIKKMNFTPMIPFCILFFFSIILIWFYRNTVYIFYQKDRSYFIKRVFSKTIIKEIDVDKTHIEIRPKFLFIDQIIVFDEDKKYHGYF